MVVATLRAAAEFLHRQGQLIPHRREARRDEPGVEKDAGEPPPTQIGRALRELNIAWIGAHSPQAKGRIERFFQTAEDRLVKGLQAEGVKTLEQAHTYLEQEFLGWWEPTRTVKPASSDDAHRPLDQEHDLTAILSHVETRQVKNHYTLEFERRLYAIERTDIGRACEARRCGSRNDEMAAWRSALGSATGATASVTEAHRPRRRRRSVPLAPARDPTRAARVTG